MRNLSAWAILVAVFLIAGEGLNIFRVEVECWLAYGHSIDGLSAIAGLCLAFLATAWLGGFVYYRDKKRGKLKREGWLGRPVQRQPRRTPVQLERGSSTEDTTNTSS